jgi:TPP-dependent pyruvate/acetoin dehydrogenase alpha subunit
LSDSDPVQARPADASPALSRYRAMQLCRRFEETVHERFHSDEGVPGPLHLAIGQEAVAVGACHDLRPTDVITSTHRGHHHCLAKGAKADRMMAELLGRRTGYSHGRGGSMHVAIPDIGLLGTNGIVGGGIPIATGAAYGLQIQKRDDVAICFFGEGAAAEGVFHEALNVAALWKLPIVFLCENNQYVELAAQDLHVAGEIWKRGESYGIPGVHVDGNDIDAVRGAVDTAVARARAGDGPSLIEALTFRWFGHYAGDKAAFRTEEEVAAGLAGDPVARARKALDPNAAAAIDAEVEAEIASALEFALSSPISGPEVLSLDHMATA